MKKTAKKTVPPNRPRSFAPPGPRGKAPGAVQPKSSRATDESAVLAGVMALARSCDYETQHAHQVTKLALKMFDDLKSLHGLNARHRLLLQSASLLHDIGWVKGRVRHHKTSRDMILKSFTLPLSREEKILVALAARYHRKALPKDTHKYYGVLNEFQKKDLGFLAAILRFADGLDRSHVSCVQDLTCRIDPQAVTVEVASETFSEWDEAAALKKADLFRDVFRKDVRVKGRDGHEC